MSSLLKVLSILGPRERMRAFLVFALGLVMTVLEIAGIGTVAGFVATVADPELLTRSKWLLQIQAALGITDRREFFIVAGCALLVIFVLRNVVGIVALWQRLSFLHGTRQTLTTRLLSYYLDQPYVYFLKTNSATISKNLIVEVNNLITGCLYSWLTLISDSIMALAVIVVLMWQNSALTMLALLCVGGIVAMLPVFVGKRVKRLGVLYRQLNDGLIRTTNEAVGGIKEIMVAGREPFFLDRYAGIAHRHAQVTVRYMLLTDGPRYLLELLIVGAILAAILGAVVSGADTATFAGTVTLFAAAAYRMMPVAHRMVSSIAGLQFNSAVLDGLAEGLKAPKPVKRIAGDVVPLPFAQSVSFRNISFGYSGTDREVISDLSFDIPSRHSVAFVGPTGAGKTTIVDLLIGLLDANAGTIEVDGVRIDADNKKAWQANIGYVPQFVYLLDDTIKNNIAIGVPEDRIDTDALRKAAQLAHVDEFVEALPEGYETVVGERGVRLSGGQRQRIGIARALYRQARLLVLDEATSSLDGITEAVIERAIDDLSHSMTVVIIAHRLTTVRRCDVIYLVEGGKIVASGSYDELMGGNQTFRAMARAAE